MNTPANTTSFFSASPNSLAVTIEASAACLVARVPVLWIAGPGQGKTAAARALARSVGVEFAFLSLNAQAAATLCGLAYVEKGRVKIASPDFWAELAARKQTTLVLIDEVASPLDREARGALLQALVEEEIFGVSIEKLRFVATCNPTSQGVGASELEAAFLSRFACFAFSQTLSEWVRGYTQGFADGWLSIDANFKAPSRMHAASFARAFEVVYSEGEWRAGESDGVNNRLCARTADMFCRVAAVLEQANRLDLLPLVAAATLGSLGFKVAQWIVEKWDTNPHRLFTAELSTLGEDKLLAMAKRVSEVPPEAYSLQQWADMLDRLAEALKPAAAAALCALAQSPAHRRMIERFASEASPPKCLREI